MRPIFLWNRRCVLCKEVIAKKSHCDRKFHHHCRKKFYNDINNAARLLKKKIHPQFQKSHGDRCSDLFEVFAKNDHALRKAIHSHDFDFLPVPKTVLTAWGYDFDRYSFTEVNLRTGGRIYWTYSLGVEVEQDQDTITIRFRDTRGNLLPYGL